MRKLQLLVLSLAFFVPLSQAQSQPCSAINRENCVYVSTLTGNRIYRFNASTKAATVINDGSGRAIPELPAALVEGPDKLLYYADVSNCANTSTYVVRRFDPFAPLGAKGLNSTLESVLAGGSGSICPAGLTFDVEGNLYANTQPFAGVYKIVKVQGSTQTPVSKVPLGQLNGPATAFEVLPASDADSTGGAGIIFSNSGDLLFVGQNSDQVLFSSALNPPFSSPVPFITDGLSNPIGTIQDNVGGIFVANHQTRNIFRCGSDGKSCAGFATFVDSNDRPVYLDTNAEGNLFVATEQIVDGVRKNGKIWFLTGSGSCPGSNCNSAGSIPKVNGKIAPAYGIGLSATSALRPDISGFGPGPDGVFGTADDVASRIFDFGTSFFGLSYPSGVLTAHKVTVKAQEAFPGDLTFASSATQCNPYHGKKGKCVVYELVDFIPTKNVDYKEEYSAYIKYSGQIPIQPALLHDSRSLAEILLPGVPDFPDNIFTRYDQGPPGVDPGTGGKTTNNFTAYVSVDLGALGDASPPSFVTPIAPTQDCSDAQITVVKRGQGLPVKISIADQFGNTVTNATARLGVAQILGNSLVPDDVRSNVNFENRFRVQSNVYVYNLVTDDLEAGCHVLTAAPDRVSPFRFPPAIAVVKIVP